MRKMMLPNDRGSQMYRDFVIPETKDPSIEPYAGGLRFEKPFPLADQPLQELGLLDVTKPPFLADATGKEDCTDVLNEAIKIAQRYQLVCYFPLGIYTVSDTLLAGQYFWWDGYPHREYRAGTRKYPVIIMGERQESDDGETLRPTIYLSPKSKGFTFPETYKPVIDVFRGNCPEANAAPGSIENMITGLHIEIGEGNIGAIGVDFYAAQGCSIEDCVIDVGDGYCGIWGAAGNGGSHAQNIIRGGKVGVDLSKGTPGAVMSGFIFDHQSRHAIVGGTKQAVDFVGCKIYTDSAVPPVVSFGGTYDLINQGQLSLIDCTVEFDDPAESHQIQAVLSSRESIYLRNVYVKNASHIVWNPDGTRLATPSNNWCCIEEFAHGIDSMPHEGRVYDSPIYIDREKLAQPTWGGPVEEAIVPSDLQTKHLYHIPLWQDVLEYNVKKYGAVGDGIADDTAALQRAIDENEYVFLPKGYYRITKTLQLRDCTKLVGVAQGLSQILVTQTPDGWFAETQENVPALDTPDVADASVVLAYCGLVTSRVQTNIYALRWRVAGNSILRNFTFYADPAYRIVWLSAERSEPWILVTGNGGGRWYNFWCDITQGGENYRILRVLNTHQPFAIYSCNVEHSRAEYEMDIINSENIVLYNLKSECNASDLLIKDSRNVALFSKGGDATAFPGKALVNVENSTDITLTLLYDYRIYSYGHSAEFFSGTWFEPELWHMLRDSNGEEDVLVSPPCQRPCLYKLGNYKDCF